MLYCTLSNSASLFTAAKIRKDFQYPAIKHAKSGVFLRQPIAQKPFLHKQRKPFITEFSYIFRPTLLKEKEHLNDSSITLKYYSLCL